MIKTNRYTSRKLLCFIVSFLFAGLALMTGHLTGSEWVTAACLFYGTYVGGNVVAGKVP